MKSWTAHHRKHIAERWPSSYDGTSTSSEPHIEAALHELCHAATFNIDAHRYGQLSDYVGDRFEGLSRLAADRKEALGLAIELRIAKRIGLKLNVRKLISGVAWSSDKMREGGFSLWAGLIRRQGANSKSKKYERQVMCWLEGVRR